LQTDFGLQVTYDEDLALMVAVPSSYFGATCGLCGNFDEEAGDEAATLPDGTKAASVDGWLDAWRDAACWDFCGGRCPQCRAVGVRAAVDVGVAASVAAAVGVGVHIHVAVAVHLGVGDCAFDVCQYKGHHDTLCGAVAAYVAACQERGVRLGEWRTPDFCSPVCPYNSHYELCGPGCPATCGDAGGACESPCAEGCFCDDGFVLSGDQCVPAAQCGCRHRGRYYKLGQGFYADGGCRERCRCEAGGAVTCWESPCGPHEECRVERGVLGCHPAGYGRLVVAGDPHHVTFDGRSFHVRGSCAYVLARLCRAGPGLANFSVLLENRSPDGGGNAVLMKKVVVAVHGYVVAMERGRAWELNGERHTLPLATEDEQLRVSQEGTNMVLEAASGLQLLYNAASYLLLTVPSSYQGHLCGLGGNYNGDKDDDFQLPDGTVTRSMEEFVASWKVPGEDGACTDGCGTDCPVCDAPHVAPYRAGTSCGLIRDPEGPFGRCHPRVSPGEYFDHCLYDVCAAGGARDTLCQSLQAYAAACQAAGADIGAWRTSSFCPLSCPPHSHYELCTRSCEATCAGLAVAAPCGPRCFEGCRCDDGFLFDGAACVSLERCGC
ncbi:FCGBP protein, partial [Nothocercus julius]|nr:FCGBP protein [Nothocercus julius]